MLTCWCSEGGCHVWSISIVISVKWTWVKSLFKLTHFQVRWGGGDFLLNPACVDGTYLKSEGEECQCEWSVVGMLNMSSGLFPNAAICPQGCRNGGVCVAPGICSCPEGWLGGACHTGEFQLVPMNRAQLKHETTSSKDVRQDFYAGVRESRHLLTSVAACWRFSPSPPSVFSFYD